MTAFEHNPVAHLVLGEGRHLCALVADSASSDRLEKSLDVACTSGVKSGWFKEYTGADVIVGGNALPAVIPPHNMSQAAQNLVAETLEGYDDPDDEDQAEENLAEAALTAAENFAEEHGLEIRVGCLISARFRRVQLSPLYTCHSFASNCRNDGPSQLKEMLGFKM